MWLVKKSTHEKIKAELVAADAYISELTQRLKEQGSQLLLSVTEKDHLRQSLIAKRNTLAQPRGQLMAQAHAAGRAMGGAVDDSAGADDA